MFSQFLPKVDQESYLTHQKWMTYALNLADIALKSGEVPVGAVIVDAEGKLIAQAANRKEKTKNPTAHAEMLAITQASQSLDTWRLEDCTLYVTLEPCPMCTGAIIQARLGLLVYGVDDPKTGAVRSVLNLPDSNCSNHRLRVLAGIKESACREQLQSWFAQLRL
ncbi:cytosine/adenosine deaminase [Gloeocapsa sp. PCC 73106]|nr:nucleoside deaminase [Gloeocapsa sp. PCC 73106]ELR97014.1 cytosine/adenosine deaminase [Gloeocapsa sp. PCC 73106]